MRDKGSPASTVRGASDEDQVLQQLLGAGARLLFVVAAVAHVVAFAMWRG